MRRWFVIILIVLLPWRAWAGDIMTMAQAGQPDQAAHCADHRPAALDVADDHGHHANSPGEPVPHAVCDICNGPALAASMPVALGHGALPQARDAAGPERFDSALPLPGLKPPIS